ncbi:cytochrome o ubiquinol oxidase subunit IV, partial [Candidatus Saccharibacteria bacterium]|nr:cytochrome o ubiquinol oxidase subunit IV [Candidatus Saccharibacteria bacterium]
LAAAQLYVQSVFFLHLSAERKLRMTLWSTLFTIMVVVIIVVGSLWIMQNLNYNMMPDDVSQYIQQEENIHER